MVIAGGFLHVSFVRERPEIDVESVAGWSIYRGVITLAEAGTENLIPWPFAVLAGIFFVLLPPLLLFAWNGKAIPFGAPGILLWLLGVTLFASAALIAGSLWVWGAKEVRGYWPEVIFLTLVGHVWLAFAIAIFPWLGLSLRDDAMERKNVAGMLALSGAILAVALTYAGGSLGEGPEYWNNYFSAGLGTGGVFGLWLVLEMGGHVSASVAEERDVATGLRVGAFLLAVGLILGRAVAGDWHSVGATIHDFIQDGWPALVLVVVAVLVEVALRPTFTNPFPNRKSRGLLPAMVYIGVALVWLWNRGKWEGMPQ